MDNTYNSLSRQIKSWTDTNKCTFICIPSVGIQSAVKALTKVRKRLIKALWGKAKMLVISISVFASVFSNFLGAFSICLMYR